MKAKQIMASMILMFGLAQGCRASFQNVDKQKSNNGGGDAVPGDTHDGDGMPGDGDQKPDLDPSNPNNPVNPIPGIDQNNIDSNVDPIHPGKGDPVDPMDGGKGKLFLTVTLPAPTIKMGELKMQAIARLNTQTEPPKVRWAITGPQSQMVIGSIDQNGVYTSPKIIDRSFPITVIATLIANPNVWGKAPLIVEPFMTMEPNKPVLTVTTPVDVVKAGEIKVPATAILNTQTTPPAVTWSIIPPADVTMPGTIDQNGVYTSPKTVDKEFPITIVAVLKSDPTVIGIKAIIVKPLVDPTQPKPTLMVTLPSPEIKAGEEKMQAKAKLSSQVEPPVVIWSIMGPAARSDIGSIDQNGVYTSPKLTETAFPVVITATLVSDPTIFGNAVLLVLPNEQIFARCTRGSEMFPILADVYQINSTAMKIPNFSNPAEARKVATVCMDKYAVAPRNFDGGFPDVPNVQEWFALNTKTQIIIPQDGNYTFYLNSDDGSRLTINNTVVIDNDGHHQAMSPDPQDLPNSGQKEATVYLLRGSHDLVLDYFQGPRYRMALELKWKKPGSGNIDYVPRENFK